MTQLLKPSVIVHSIFNRSPIKKCSICTNGSVFTAVISTRLYTSKSAENADKKNEEYIIKKKKIKADRSFTESSIKSVLGEKTYNKVMGVVDLDALAKKKEERKRFAIRRESNKLVSGKFYLHCDPKIIF